MLRLFARAFQANERRENALKEKTASPSGPAFERNGTMSTPSPERSPWWQPNVTATGGLSSSAAPGWLKPARAFFGAILYRGRYGDSQVSPGNEAHISAFATSMLDDTGAESRLYLHSSPEFAAKKLLAAGEPRIFSFAHVFRNRERGRLHHPEFTMLEWYRAGAPYQRLIEDCMGLLARAVSAAGSRDLRFGGHVANPFEEPEILTVAGPSTAMPISIFWPRSRGPNPTARRWRPTPAITESEPLRTTAGLIFSARSWRRRSSRNSAMAARRSSWTIRRARRRSPNCRKTRVSRSGSNFMRAASNSPIDWRTDRPNPPAAPLRGSNGGAVQDLWRGLSD